MNRKILIWTIKKICLISDKLKKWPRQNLANFITAFGLLMTSWYLATVYYHPERLKQIFFSGLSIGLTDYFDGKIARRFGAESMLGSIIDRIRDLVFIYPSLFILVWRYRWESMSLPFSNVTIPFTKGVMFVIFGLEGFLLFIFFAGSILNLRGRKIDLLPNKWGQKKMYCSFVVVLVWLLSLAVEKDLGLPLIYCSIWVIYLGFGLMLYWRVRSLENYWQRRTQRKTIFQKPKDPK